MVAATGVMMHMVLPGCCRWSQLLRIQPGALSHWQPLSGDPHGQCRRLIRGNHSAANSPDSAEGRPLDGQQQSQNTYSQRNRNNRDLQSFGATNHSAPPPWMPQLQLQGEQGYWVRRMKRLADKQQHDKVLAVFDEMKAAGVAPDIDVFNNAIASCVPAGKANQAFRLFSALRKRGLKPNPHTASGIFNTLARSKGTQLPQRALEFNQKLIDSGYPRNTHTYNALLWVCVSGGAAEACMDTFETMCGETGRHRSPPDAVTFSLLIRACGMANDFYQATDAFHAAKFSGNVGKETLPDDGMS